jgi:hypothetical protein
MTETWDAADFYRLAQKPNATTTPTPPKDAPKAASEAAAEAFYAGASHPTPPKTASQVAAELKPAPPPTAEPTAPAATSTSSAALPPTAESATAALVGLGVQVPADAVVDPALATEFAAIATEAKLSPAQAQALTDAHGRFVAAERAATDAKVDAWQAESMRDISETDRASAAALVRAHGDDALRDALNSSGLGNHPALIRWAANVSRALSERNGAR